MRQIFPTILKGRSFQKILMTTQTSNKKTIVQHSNHLKQIAQKNKLPSLSANQCGSFTSLFVMLQKRYLKANQFNNYNSKLSQYQTYINPKILDSSVKDTLVWQECPSYPNLKFLIKRSNYVIAEYMTSFKDKQTTKLQLSGFQAILFQHQMSHIKCLNLFDLSQQVDLVSSQQKDTQNRQRLRHEFKKFRKQRQNFKIQHQNQLNQIQRINRQMINKNQDLEGNTKNVQIQINTKIFKYDHCKELKNFIQYQIIDSQ